MRIRTQVAIVGSGPAGMLLAHLLHNAGIECVVIEQRSREYVAARIRAGVLEQGTVEVLRAAGLGARLDAEGFEHHGVYLSTQGRGFRIDFPALVGRSVWIYGQTEVQKDLYSSADERAITVFDEADEVAPIDVDTDHPSVSFVRHGATHTIDADFVAGCDGFHGVCRTLLPASIVRTYERVYPFGWLGILSETPPVSDELIYAQHQRGFALCSMRNPMLSRYYVQCALDDQVAQWSDTRFWDELRARIPADAADGLVTGPSIEKSITPLRSFVSEPMQFGRLFLAGDAAHIVPPTGAKGLNLAVSDVVYLASALSEFYDDGGSTGGLDGYSNQALNRVWKAVRFSWWMTTQLHRFDDESGFAHKLQEAELDYLSISHAAQVSMAENYTGMPL